ncbi:ribonuclease P MRP subunit POP8 [Pyrenophora seminiperda CCB06]|uniref:Ribonuclease P MRP subunit POP8 n=1 Tax=Pyrenophora seminiperda CCB06 TaxID=1302712 RepID=A0A3M7LYG6_9PLEO|nr:ribonuclease P MRP subunit POP8 [Pyrenophora seminiperda CCB06]
MTLPQQPPAPPLPSTTKTTTPNPPSPATTTTTTTTIKKRKRNTPGTATAQKESQHILHQTTFRKTQWSYFVLELVTPSTTSSPSTTTTTTTTPQPDISPLLTLTLLTKALCSYLGTTGAAIPLDILKILGRKVWLRVPRLDARGVRAGLSSWVGSVDAEEVGGDGGGKGKGVVVGCQWRVCGEGWACIQADGGGGEDLF